LVRDPKALLSVPCRFGNSFGARKPSLHVASWSLKSTRQARGNQTILCKLVLYSLVAGRIADLFFELFELGFTLGV
jgi:hypothetical protein